MLIFWFIFEAMSQNPWKKFPAFKYAALVCSLTNG